MFENTILYVLTFISGLFFGSFFNLVADRVVKGKSVLLGRSECDYCGKTLHPKNLIPLFSFIFQKGRCSFCRERLSFYYPVSEIITGLLFVFVAYLSGIFKPADPAYQEYALFYAIFKGLSFVYLLGVASFYFILTLTDLKYRLLPDKVVYPAIWFVLVLVILSPLIMAGFQYVAFKNHPLGVYMLQIGEFDRILLNIGRSFLILLSSSAALSLFFVILILLTKGKGVGGGDVKLAFLIGLVNRFPYSVLAIFLGFIFGAVVSLFLILIRKKTMKDSVPFGPFLILGSVVALLWGELIYSWYMGFL